ncbi:MAG: amidohydrolase [Actinomycetota bacterium]|nr:amidohydrolase [Actinomycetota bacterium]
MSDTSWLAAWVDRHEAELVGVRRQLHAHPELGHAEIATTGLLVTRLAAAGLTPTVLPSGTGLVCDVGPAGGERVLALRADLDALPLPDDKSVPYRSTVPGVCHACGHDVHTAIVLGVGLALAELNAHRPLPGRVRLVFQPAEELTPGGAIGVIAAGALEGVERMLALHCDPRLAVGQVGVRVGAITSAADSVEVRLTGPGGHTARPHLTVDLVYALSRVVTDLPAALSRLVDPRAGLALVWGMVAAGSAANAIPQSGVARGTVRMLDKAVWEQAPELVRTLVEAAVAPFGAKAEIDYRQGVPPVINEARSTGLLAVAADRALGAGSAVPTPQSLGGEDFAWYLDRVPGALARLGVRRVDDPLGPVDLHSGSFDVDERAIGLGVRVLAQAALDGLGAPASPDEPAEPDGGSLPG